MTPGFIKLASWSCPGGRNKRLPRREKRGGSGSSLLRQEGLKAQGVGACLHHLKVQRLTGRKLGRLGRGGQEQGLAAQQKCKIIATA